MNWIYLLGETSTLCSVEIDTIYIYIYIYIYICIYSW